LDNGRCDEESDSLIVALPFVLLPVYCCHIFFLIRQQSEAAKSFFIPKSQQQKPQQQHTTNIFSGTLEDSCLLFSDNSSTDSSYSNLLSPTDISDSDGLEDAVLTVKIFSLIQMYPILQHL
jgi:hypothetical protein